MIRFMPLALVCSFPLLTACTSSDLTASEGQQSPQFGTAVHSDIAAQIVNSGAPAPGEPMTMEGQRAALAQDRYVKGTVIQPKDVEVDSTSSNSTGGNSSSSANN